MVYLRLLQHRPGRCFRFECRIVYADRHFFGKPNCALRSFGPRQGHSALVLLVAVIVVRRYIITTVIRVNCVIKTVVRTKELSKEDQCLAYIKHYT